MIYGSGQELDLEVSFLCSDFISKPLSSLNRSAQLHPNTSVIEPYESDYVFTAKRRQFVTLLRSPSKCQTNSKASEPWFPAWTMLIRIKSFLMYQETSCTTVHSSWTGKLSSALTSSARQPAYQCLRCTKRKSYSPELNNQCSTLTASNAADKKEFLKISQAVGVGFGEHIKTCTCGASLMMY